MNLSVWKFLPLSFLLFNISASAGVIGVQQFSGFFYATSLGANSLEYTSIGYSVNDFAAAGISVGFENNLDADNLGTVSWSFSNTTGGILENAWFFAFLDADIDSPLNTYFNESGSLSSVPGTGASDNLADSWEIDEPGYVFGDIYDHLLNGYLDNTNNVSAGFEDDVSFALGFNLGDLLVGDTVTGLFELSRLDIGGLMQLDAESADSFYFNGTVDVRSSEPVAVPEPPVIFLLLTSLLALLLSRKKSLI